MEKEKWISIEVPEALAEFIKIALDNNSSMIAFGHIESNVPLNLYISESNRGGLLETEPSDTETSHIWQASAIFRLLMKNKLDDITAKEAINLWHEIVNTLDAYFESKNSIKH